MLSFVFSLGLRLVFFIVAAACAAVLPFVVTVVDVIAIGRVVSLSLFFLHVLLPGAALDVGPVVALDVISRLVLYSPYLNKRKDPISLERLGGLCCCSRAVLPEPQVGAFFVVLVMMALAHVLVSKVVDCVL